MGLLPAAQSAAGLAEQVYTINVPAATQRLQATAATARQQEAAAAAVATKTRKPAWTDRVLFHSCSDDMDRRIRPTSYSAGLSAAAAAAAGVHPQVLPPPDPQPPHPPSPSPHPPCITGGRRLRNAIDCPSPAT